MDNNNKILVSAIAPCFRMKKYLQLFLQELPQQTFFEHLELVLDHNDPEPEELVWVSEFQAKYPGKLKHIIVRPVEPIGTSMNRCIKESAGDLITIWNLDDLRTPNSIELQYLAMNSAPDIGIVYGDYQIVDSFGKKDGPWSRNAWAKAEDFTRSMVFGPFIMFKKALCTQIGYFDEQLLSGADFDLSIRLSMAARAVMAEGNLGYYLNEGKGASTRPDSKQALERTVIELRYGIFDKLDYSYLSRALANYSIDTIFSFGQAIKLKKLVPSYEDLITRRQKRWLIKGWFNFLLSYYFNFKRVIIRHSHLHSLAKKIKHLLS